MFARQLPLAALFVSSLPGVQILATNRQTDKPTDKFVPFLNEVFTLACKGRIHSNRDGMSASLHEIPPL